MQEILEIEFKGRRKEYAANPQQFPFLLGEPAIVEVERGLDLGKVSYLGWRPGMESGDAPPNRVIRRAAPPDLKVLEQNRDRELECKQVARKKIAEHNLDMKLVDVELQWDGRKTIFYFTAEGRVDFRELVKDLASTFRSRIDLRQIGARDETKRTGGYGICGRPLCCATFLTEFKPITTQMPRDQFLPLNPSKLSGVCGRLKCCLRYELDVYREFQRQCPKVGHPVKDEAKGNGEIDKLDVVRQQIQVRYGGGETERYSPGEFVQLTNWRPEMPKNECICTCGKRPPVPTQPAQQIEANLPPPQVSAGAERVTLLAGGGLGMKAQDGVGEVHYGANLEATPSPGKPKKKRRRRKKGKKPDTGTAGVTSPPSAAGEPPDVDGGDDDDEE